jgi:hypothetical protein
MKTNRFPRFVLRRLAGIVPLSVGAGLGAAPLTWFPGPSLDAPRSGAATTIASGGDNLLIGGDSSAVQELAATNSGWTYRLPFYGAVLGPGAVANGDRIIVYGGSDGASPTSTVIGYSPSDNSTQLASMSVARSGLGYAPDANGYAYAIGGLDGANNPLASAERYNPDSDTWAALAPLPVASCHFPAVFDGTNRIYILGGLTNIPFGTETATALRYSVRSNNWTAMASMPVPTAWSAAALGADGKIYVVGGVSGGVATNVVQVYKSDWFQFGDRSGHQLRRLRRLDFHHYRPQPTADELYQFNGPFRLRSDWFGPARQRRLYVHRHQRQPLPEAFLPRGEPVAKASTQELAG